MNFDITDEALDKIVLEALDSMDFNSTNKPKREMTLTKEKKQELRDMLPFYYISDLEDVTPSVHIVVEVTKRYLTTALGLDIQVVSNVDKHIFKSLSDTPHIFKVRMREQYNTNYKKMQQKLFMYDEFKKENSEYFI